MSDIIVKLENSKKEDYSTLNEKEAPKALQTPPSKKTIEIYNRSDIINEKKIGDVIRKEVVFKSTFFKSFCTESVDHFFRSLFILGLCGAIFFFCFASIFLSNGYSSIILMIFGWIVIGIAVLITLLMFTCGAVVVGFYVYRIRKRRLSYRRIFEDVKMDDSYAVKKGGVPLNWIHTENIEFDRRDMIKYGKIPGMDRQKINVFARRGLDGIVFKDEKMNWMLSEDNNKGYVLRSKDGGWNTFFVKKICVGNHQVFRVIFNGRQGQEAYMKKVRLEYLADLKRRGKRKDDDEEYEEVIDDEKKIEEMVEKEEEEVYERKVCIGFFNPNYFNFSTETIGASRESIGYDVHNGLILHTKMSYSNLREEQKMSIIKFQKVDFEDSSKQTVQFELDTRKGVLNISLQNEKRDSAAYEIKIKGVKNPKVFGISSKEKKFYFKSLRYYNNIQSKLIMEDTSLDYIN